MILCHRRQGSRRGHVDILTLCCSGGTSQRGKGAIVKAFGSIEKYPLFWDNGYSQERLPGGGDVCKRTLKCGSNDKNVRRAP